MQPAGTDKPRIATIDIARGAALLAMAVYHLGWDVELFGYMDSGTTTSGGWKLFARTIATSFLFLVGVSLVLAHAKSIRWKPFGKRLAMVVAAAAAITIASRIAFPSGFIFFGILHHIALASFLGLAFLRLPVPAIILAAAVAVALPHIASARIFDWPPLWWVGLSTFRPVSNDYVPLFPWFGAVLAGIAAGKWAQETGLLFWLSRFHPSQWANPLTFIGKHSLAFYLLHQPVLIGCVWLFAQAWPAAAQAPQARFLRACDTQCTQVRGVNFCESYCACVTNTLESENRLENAASPRPSVETQSRLQAIASACTMEAAIAEADKAANEEENGDDE